MKEAEKSTCQRLPAMVGGVWTSIVAADNAGFGGDGSAQWEFQFCALAILLVSPRFFIGTNKTDLHSDMTIRLPATRITSHRAKI